MGKSSMDKEKMVRQGNGILTAAVVALFFLVSATVASAATIWVPEGGNQTIQQAVDNASAGDTIIVRDGTYTESVDVNKDNLTIKSENGSASTIVNASGNNAFTVQGNYVNISGFTVQNASFPYVGISLWQVSYCSITGNNVLNIFGDRDGIYLYRSNYNNLTNNIAFNNGRYGIYLYRSSDNNLTNNTAFNNTQYGIYLRGSSSSPSNNNTLTNNTLTNNTVYDFYSNEYSHNNTVEYLRLSSYPTTVSFTYDNGVGLKGVETAPGDPAGKTNINKYVNATNVSIDSWLYLNVSYEDLGNVAEDSLRLWRHNGTAWASVTGTNGVNTAGNHVYANITEFSVFAPLGDESTYIPPVPLILTNTTGNYWVNYTWTNGTSGNVTDSYNVSMNGTWVYNGINTYYNASVGLCGWANISVWAYNASGTGTLSRDNASEEVQAPCPASGAPNITDFAPLSPVNDTYCTDRTFNVSVNQTVNVTWYLNDTAQVPKNVSVTAANYTFHALYIGENNVTAVTENANGTDRQEWVWNVTAAPAAGAPNITDFAPTSPVNDTYCTDRTFNVSVNQTVNVTWYLNDTAQVPENVSVTAANYTFHAEYVGEHNVSAVAENPNGMDMQTWGWNVTEAPEPPLAVPDFSASGLFVGIGMLGIVLAVSVFKRRR